MKESRGLGLVSGGLWISSLTKPLPGNGLLKKEAGWNEWVRAICCVITDYCKHSMPLGSHCLKMKAVRRGKNEEKMIYLFSSYIFVLQD